MRGKDFPDAGTRDVLVGALSGVRLTGAGPQFSSEALFQLFESIPVAISITAGPTHRFVYANSHYRRALVPGAADPVGRDMQEVFGTRLRTGIYTLRDKAFEEGRIIAAPEEATPASSKSPSMSWDITYYPLRGDAGDVAGILTFGVDVTERVAARRNAERRAEEERERAEEASFDRARLELAVEATDLGIWEWNVGTGETRWSERQKAIWGLDPEYDASYEYWRASIHPEDRDEVLGRVERTLDRESGGDQRMEHRIVRPDGGVRWIASRGRMIYDEKTGKPVRLIGTVRDITEQKSAEMALKDALASNEILLREVNHRIKNSLQLVSSMLSLQSLRSDDLEVRRLMQEAQSRVQVVAAVHERLYRSQDVRFVELDTFVEMLCRDVERTMTEASDAIVVDVVTESMTIGNDRAVPVALVLNELLTNALKYAYPERRGVIEVSLRHLADGMVSLRVADRGVGLPADFAERQGASLGLRIIEGLVRQIRGELGIAEQKPGCAFEITFDVGQADIQA